MFLPQLLLLPPHPLLVLHHAELVLLVVVRIRQLLVHHLVHLLDDPDFEILFFDLISPQSRIHLVIKPLRIYLVPLWDQQVLRDEFRVLNALAGLAHPELGDVGVADGYDEGAGDDHEVEEENLVNIDARNFGGEPNNLNLEFLLEVEEEDDGSEEPLEVLEEHSLAVSG